MARLGAIAEVKARMLDFNTAMTNNGIDAQYGLVEFGGTSGNGSTSGTATLFQDIVDFTTFTASGNPFDNLSASFGGSEKGSLATSVGLNNATFRTGSVINVILLTDEDDDSSATEFSNADADLTANDALFNFIGVPGVGNTDARYGALASDHGGSAFNILDFRNDPDPFFDNFINTKVQEIQQAAIPEPSSYITFAGLALCFGAAGWWQRRRRKSQ